MATSPITKPLENIETKHIRIIGVPLDLGQSRRGVDMGPSAMRVAGLEAKLEALGYDVKDAGNIPVALAETKSEGDPHAKYLKEITETCSKEADLVVKTLESGAIPVVLGGDHSIAAGTVSGLAEFYRRNEEQVLLGDLALDTDLRDIFDASRRRKTARTEWFQHHIRFSPNSGRRCNAAGRAGRTINSPRGRTWKDIIERCVIHQNSKAVRRPAFALS